MEEAHEEAGAEVVQVLSERELVAVEFSEEPVELPPPYPGAHRAWAVHLRALPDDSGKLRNPGAMVFESP